MSSIMLAAARQSSPQSAQFMEQAGQPGLGARLAGFVKKSAAALMIAASLASPAFAGSMQAQDAAPSVQQVQVIQQQKAGKAVIETTAGSELEEIMPGRAPSPSRLYPVVEESRDLLEDAQFAGLMKTRMRPGLDSKQKTASSADVGAALDRICLGWEHAARMAGKSPRAMTQDDVVNVAKMLLESSRPGEVATPFQYLQNRRASVERGSQMFAERINAGAPEAVQPLKAPKVGSPFDARFDGPQILADAARGVLNGRQTAGSQLSPGQ